MVFLSRAVSIILLIESFSRFVVLVIFGCLSTIGIFPFNCLRYANNCSVSSSDNRVTSKRKGPSWASFGPAAISVLKLTNLSDTGVVASDLENRVILILVLDINFRD